MYPRVFDWNTEEFTSRGLGALSGCTECKVTEELNGEYKLELKCLTGSENVEHLQVRNIIVCKASATSDYQAFRIYSVKRTIRNQITAYAFHISYDLSGVPCAPFTAVGINATLANIRLLGGYIGLGLKFSFRTNLYDVGGDFVVDMPKSVKSIIYGDEDSITDVFGGEWEFNNYLCTLQEKRGIDNGIRVSYGVNMSEYEKQRENNVYTHVIAFYKKEDTCIYSDPFETGASAPIRTLFLDRSSKYRTEPTKATLDTYAEEYATSHASLLSDSQNLKIDPFLFEDQVVGIGDTVQVAYGGELLSVRVVKVVWDAVSERYTNLELGTPKTSIATTIKNLR